MDQMERSRLNGQNRTKWEQGGSDQIGQSEPM